MISKLAASAPDRPKTLVPRASSVTVMSASVTPDVRRSQEMDLLAGYHARLVAEGVGGYGFDECLEDYRRALLIGFTYAVQAGGFSNMEHARNAALIHAMATRCEAACLDLGLASMLN